jgi:hypothetical protein
MRSMLTTSLFAAVAACALSTSPARADETVIEKHTYESEQHAVEVPPPPVEKHVVEEHTVTKEVPAVQKRTDTTVTTTTTDRHHDDDND